MICNTVTINKLIIVAANWSDRNGKSKFIKQLEFGQLLILPSPTKSGRRCPSTMVKLYHKHLGLNSRRRIKQENKQVYHATAINFKLEIFLQAGAKDCDFLNLFITKRVSEGATVPAPFA